MRYINLLFTYLLTYLLTYVLILESLVIVPVLHLEPQARVNIAESMSKI